MGIGLDTIRNVALKSGNQCAFPGCNCYLIREDGLFVTQLCHIEAQSKEGPRFNPKLSPEERDGPSNLMFMCYEHHKVIDSDIRTYTVDVLKRIKADHEKSVKEKKDIFSEIVIRQIQEETNEYWANIKDYHRKLDKHAEYKIKFHADSNFSSLINDCWDVVKRIEGLQQTIDENPAATWECLNLGLNNCLINLRRDLLQINIRYLEQKLLTSPKNEKVLSSIKKAQDQLRDFIDDTAYYD